MRLANDEVELIVTTDVGPRVIRFGFIGERNMFAEIDGQQGGTGEDEWMIRGGHRFWIAPEEKPKTYELDNAPVEVEEIAAACAPCSRAGPLSGVAKTMEIALAGDRTRCSIVHTLTNDGADRRARALGADGHGAGRHGGHSAAAQDPAHRAADAQPGMEPLGLHGFLRPALDARSRYIFFRQDRAPGPTSWAWRTAKGGWATSSTSSSS